MKKILYYPLLLSVGLLLSVVQVAAADDIPLLLGDLTLIETQDQMQPQIGLFGSKASQIQGIPREIDLSDHDNLIKEIHENTHTSPQVYFLLCACKYFRIEQAKKANQKANKSDETEEKDDTKEPDDTEESDLIPRTRFYKDHQNAIKLSIGRALELLNTDNMPLDENSTGTEQEKKEAKRKKIVKEMMPYLEKLHTLFIDFLVPNRGPFWNLWYVFKKKENRGINFSDFDEDTQLNVLKKLMNLAKAYTPPGEFNLLWLFPKEGETDFEDLNPERQAEILKDLLEKEHKRFLSCLIGYFLDKHMRALILQLNVHSGNKLETQNNDPLLEQLKANKQPNKPQLFFSDKDDNGFTIAQKLGIIYTNPAKQKKIEGEEILDFLFDIYIKASLYIQPIFKDLANPKLNEDQAKKMRSSIQNFISASHAKKKDYDYWSLSPEAKDAPKQKLYYVKGIMWWIGGCLLFYVLFDRGESPQEEKKVSKKKRFAKKKSRKKRKRRP